MFNIPTTVTGTVLFRGNGSNTTVFFPAPWLPTTPATNGDVMNYDNQSAAVLEDFGVNLYGYTRSNDNGAAVIWAQYPQVDRIAIMNNSWTIAQSFYSRVNTNPGPPLPIPIWFNYSSTESLNTQAAIGRQFPRRGRPPFSTWWPMLCRGKRYSAPIALRA